MKRVLIAEDERDLSRLLEAALHTFDATIQVVMVPSAEEAILEVTRHPFDLLVTDYRLPGITGFELIKKVRIRAEKIHVIVLTGMQDSRVDDQAKDLRLDAFLRKPITITEFIDVAVKALNLKPEEEMSVSGDKAAQLSPLLETLQEDLDALLIVLVDQQGKLLFRVGNFPDPAQEKDWVQALMPPLAAMNQSQVSLEKFSPVGVIAWKASPYDFLLSPVGTTFGLAILLKARRGSTQLSLALDKTLQARPGIQEILKEIELPPGVKVQEEQPELIEPVNTETPTRPVEVKAPQAEAQPEQQPQPEPVDEGEVSEDFLALFEGSSDKTAKEIKTADFWDNLSESELANKAANPDTITYDQALNLGLLSDDEKK